MPSPVTKCQLIMLTANANDDANADADANLGIKVL